MTGQGGMNRTGVVAVSQMGHARPPDDGRSAPDREPPELVARQSIAPATSDDALSKGILMNRLRLSALRALAVAGVCGLMLAGALPAAAATVTLSGSGTGTDEVPAGSATDKVSGTFDIDTTAGTLTYKISFQGSEAATMGHIHKGAAGTKGDVVIPFDAAVINAGGSATVTVDKALLEAIVADPAGYYVNVHTASAPGGAARGQLMTGSGTMPSAVSAGTGGQFAAQNAGNPALVALAVGAGLIVVGAAGAVAVGRRRG